MEEFKSVCTNPWCKSTFYYTERDMTIEKGPFGREKKIRPKVCHKCKGTNDITSGGVTWTDKKYEGSRFGNGVYQEISYKITKYR